jgi:hypothetical protein
VQDVYRTNQAMRERLVELVQRVDSPDIVGV